MPGRLQIIAVRLPAGDGPARRVLAEVDRLEAHSGVRVLDMALVSEPGNDTLVVSSLGADEDFGDLVSRLFPSVASPAAGGGVMPELWRQAQSLPAGTAVAFFLLEHRWAQGIFDAVEEQGGALLGAGFLTPELGLVIDAEIDAMEEAGRSVAAAQASEAQARLRAVAAWDEADEAVAAAARVRSAAAAEVLQALTDAGVVEAAAVHEAMDTLRAAGLIVVAADEAANRAVEANASTVAAADQARAEAVAENAAAVSAAEQKSAEASTAASVTSAEIRVLRYLPTRLTFALIADKLGISRGAAKSRAERAYKKLGVHSRAEAVERARALRVVP